jgi:branched-chain amino acid transport system substrate-binding protein
METVSRREFLKIAGVAGAALGMGAGLGGVVAACGGESTTTTSSALSTTSTEATTTSAATAATGASSTTTAVSSAVEMGPEVKIGFVAPKTGPLALFGVPDGYCADRFTEWVGDGIVCGDQKKHPIKLTIEDAQSDSNRAGQLAGQLIGSGANLMVASSTPDCVNPVADQCEANGVPCLCTDDPAETFIFGRGGAPDSKFKWTYLLFFGTADLVADYQSCWTKLPTNGVVGGMWPNDAGGLSYADPKTGFPAGITAAGMKVVDPGRWQVGSEDFTAQISMFKKEGCQIIHGIMTPPDAENFLKQAAQQNFQPVFMSIDKALLFPEAAEAMGPVVGNGLTCGGWWSNDWPFKSPLTGETCKEFADEYEKRTGQQWTQPLMHFCVFEMAAYALQHATDPLSYDSVLAAIETMKMDTIGGHVDFTAPVQPLNTVGVCRPHWNVYKSPIMVTQWVKGTTNMFDLKTVDNSSCSNLPTNGTPVAYRQA